MRILHIAFVIGLAGQSQVGEAQAQQAVQIPRTRQLSGLSSQEASDLIAKLENAQSRLKAGESESFELLAGSIASHEKTKVAPLDVFLQVPFKDVWNIQRVGSDNELWQPYRLAYAPDGLGKMYWDIEVILGVNGNIERITMIYMPPPPF